MELIVQLFVTRSQREDHRGHVLYEAQALLSLDADEARRLRSIDAGRTVVMHCVNCPPHGHEPLPDEIRLADLRRRYVFRARDYYEIHRFEEQLRAACQQVLAELLPEPAESADAAVIGAELLLLYRELTRERTAGLTPLDEKRLKPWRGRAVPAPIVNGLRELSGSLEP